jgi:hypothetical protein
MPSKETNFGEKEKGFRGAWQPNFAAPKSEFLLPAGKYVDTLCLTHSESIRAFVREKSSIILDHNLHNSPQ